MHPPLDRHARKQVLLARIAFERIELRRELARVQQAAQLPHLLRAAVGGAFGRSLFGAGAGPGRRGWVELALAMLRRHRVAAALLGAAAPLLQLLGRFAPWRRPRNRLASAPRGRVIGWPGVLRLVVLGAAAYTGWRIARGRGR